jgi:Na+/H+-dicarboxylate symporter
VQVPEIEWQPVSCREFYFWLCVYGLLLAYLARHFGELTLLDNLHLPIHEAGHLFFSYFGETLHLWGGTIFQLLVPALLAGYFASKRQIPGTTFCSFVLFHSLTSVATYMSDAISRTLPLVTVGTVADESDHDWYNMFHQLGVLPHAVQIGSATRLLAWCGMMGTVVWFALRYCRQQVEPKLSAASGIVD